MPEVRESDYWHSTREYISAREVFSTGLEADGRVAELEALGLAGVPVKEEPVQKLKQKERAYGGGKRKQALKGKCLKKQKKPGTADALEDHTAPYMCKLQGKEPPEHAQQAEQQLQALLEL